MKTLTSDELNVILSALAQVREDNAKGEAEDFATYYGGQYKADRLLAELGEKLWEMFSEVYGDERAMHQR